MKIAIIGGSSEISQVIFRNLNKEDHEVTMLGRKSSTIEFDLLNQDVSKILHFDMVIFVAHDHRPNNRIQDLIFRNYVQTLRRLEDNKQRSIFISTMSVSASNRSNYVKHKLRLESLFTSHNFKIVRLGLVVGPPISITQNSAFRNILRIANVPIFKFYSSKSGPFYTTNLDTIGGWFLKNSFSATEEIVSIYDKEFRSVSEFLSSIRSRRITFIPISLTKISHMIYYLRLNEFFSIFDKLLNFSDGKSLR